jgi:hypothetical protein
MCLNVTNDRAHFTMLKINSIIFNFVHKKSFTISFRPKLYFEPGSRAEAGAPRQLDLFAAGSLAARHLAAQRFSASTWNGYPIRQFLSRPPRPLDQGGRRHHRDGAARPASPSSSARSYPRRRGCHPCPLRARPASHRPRIGHLVRLPSLLHFPPSF